MGAAVEGNEGLEVGRKRDLVGHANLEVEAHYRQMGHANLVVAPPGDPKQQALANRQAELGLVGLALKERHRLFLTCGVYAPLHGPGDRGYDSGLIFFGCAVSHHRGVHLDRHVCCVDVSGVGTYPVVAAALSKVSEDSLVEVREGPSYNGAYLFPGCGL